MAVYREVDTEPAEPVATVRKSDYHMSVTARVIYLIGGIIMGLLAIRFLLALLGANPNNAFANFIYTLSHPFAAPFFSLFSYDQTLGRSRFELGTLVAIAIYGLITWLLVRIATIGAHRTV